MCSIRSPPPPTRKHILVLNKSISLIREYYMNESTRPNFLMLLSKIAEIHAWNKLKSYKLAPVSTQIFSVIKSYEQLLTDSQCNG